MNKQMRQAMLDALHIAKVQYRADARAARKFGSIPAAESFDRREADVETLIGMVERERI